MKAFWGMQFFTFKLVSIVFVIGMLKSYESQSQVLITSSGSNGTFNIQYPANVTSLQNGLFFTFISNQTLSTTGANINLNGIGTRPLLKNLNAPLVSGDILSGQAVVVIFDGSNWQLVSSSANVPTSNIWTVSGTNIYNLNQAYNVGIGTTTPINKLDVNGAVAIGQYAGVNVAPSNSLIVSGYVGIGSSNPLTNSANLEIYSNSPSPSQIIRDGLSALRFTNSAGANYIESTGISGATTPTGSADLYFSSMSNVNQWLVIKSTGLVGIGLTNPAQLLDVNGGARIRSLSVSGAVFANTNGDLYIGSIGGILGGGATGGVTYWSNNNTITASGSNFFWDNVNKRLGIGFTTPTASISISGADNTANGMNAAISVQNTLATTPASNPWYIRVGGPATQTPNSGLSIADGWGYWLSILSGSNGGFVGLNTNVPTNQLDVNGGVRIRNLTPLTAVGLNLLQADGLGNISLSAIPAINLWNLTGNNLYPANLSNKVGIGISTPLNVLDVNGSAAFGGYAGVSSAPANGLIVSGRVGIGTSAPLNSLDVNGAVAIGSYAGVSTAAANGLVVSGSVGIGTAYPAATLQINSPASTSASNALVIFNSAGTNLFNIRNDASIGIGGTIGFISGATKFVSISTPLVTNGANFASLELVGADDTGNLGGTISKIEFVNLANGGTAYNTGRIASVRGNAGNKADGDLAFYTRNAGTTAEVMRLNYLGSMGIGTSTPVSLLDINGSVSIGSYAGVNAGPAGGLIVSGNVGIGTSTPAYLLDVNGGVIRFTPSGTSVPILFNSNSSYPQIIPNSSGGFGYIGNATDFWAYTYSYQFFTYATGNYLVFSDKSLKENIRIIPSALQTVLKLRGVLYDFLPGKIFDKPVDPNSKIFSADNTNQIGFVAQEVEEILPQIVKTEPKTGFKSVGYLSLVPVLVEAIKEQQTALELQNSNQKDNFTEIANLKSEIETLKQSIEAIKRQLNSSK